MPDFPLIEGQHGLATREQLEQVGFTQGAIRYLGEVLGQRPLPGVFAPHRGPLDGQTRVVAAALWAGPRAVLTGGHALRVLGVAIPDPPATIRFLVPESTWPRRAAGAAMSRTRRWPRTRMRDGVRVASVERALADSSRFCQFAAEDLQALAIATLQGQFTSVERLEAELVGGRRNGTAPIWAGLSEFREGSWSVAEARLRRVLRRRPWAFHLNPRLLTTDGRFVGTPDAYLPDVGIAIQVHSRAFHTGRDEFGRDLWQRTVESDGRYAAHGVIVLGVAPTTLHRSPNQVLARLDSAVAARTGCAPVAVVAVPVATHRLPKAQ